MRKISPYFLFLLVLNCAFLNPRNRPITSYLDEKSAEINKSTTSRIVLSPIVVPVGTITIFSDILIIHPVSTVIPASKDAYKFIWKDPSGSIVRETFLFVPKLIFTPPYILVDMFLRSLFDFE